MSTLTKILIVLVTISSIFLCGIVVTYVALADNYKDKYDEIKTERDSFKETADDKTEQLNRKIAEKDALEDKLNREIANLKIEINTLNGDLKAANDDLKISNQRLSDMASVVETATQTSKETTKLAMDTQAQLTLAAAERTKLEAELKEISESLLERLAIIQTLEKEKKQLLEEKAELQSRMEKLLQPAGKAPAPTVIVTPPTDVARPTPVVTKKIELRGLVTAVDTKNKMASISIGTADGVKEGMRFHVTRADKFICDILIIDTDAEEAVGVLELIEEQPRAGDTIATNL